MAYAHDLSHLKDGAGPETSPGVWNAVSRLPSEVLSQVFGILTIISPPFRHVGQEPLGNSPLGWIYASHVCQFWRNVALGDATLWTDISSEFSGPWVTEALHRSGQVPITLTHASDGLQDIPPIFIERAFIPHELFRLKRVHLRSRAPHNLALAVKQLEQHVPFLEDLVLDTVALLHKPLFLPDTMSASTLPRLRKLSLRGWMPASWNVSYLHNLTHLELDTRWSYTNVLMTITECLDVLTRSPRLESIELKGVLCLSRSDPILARSPSVALPHLTRLAVESKFDIEILALLSRLELPAPCHVQVTFDIKGVIPAPELISPMVPLLTRPFRSGNGCLIGRPIEKVLIEGRSVRKNSYLAAWDGAQANTISSAKVSMTWARPTNLWPDLLQEFCEMLPLADVTALHMIGDWLHRLPTPILQIVFRRMPSVRQLTLCWPESGASNVLALLGSAEPCEGGDGQEYTAFLPQLTEMAVFSARASLPHDGEDGTDGDLVLEMLRARRVHGVGVKILRLDKYAGDERLVGALKGCVDELRHLSEGDVGKGSHGPGLHRQEIKVLDPAIFLMDVGGQSEWSE